MQSIARKLAVIVVLAASMAGCATYSPTPSGGETSQYPDRARIIPTGPG